MGRFSTLRVFSGLSLLLAGLVISTVSSFADPAPGPEILASATAATTRVATTSSHATPGATAAPPALVATANMPVATPRPASMVLEPTTASLETFAARMPANTIAGFRMGGSPELEFVFGDIHTYKQHIERFKALHQEMSTERTSFASAAHATQQALAQKRGTKRSCPAELVAQDYARASKAGLKFRNLGLAFESTYLAISQLHQLGESKGLTPDYRWQVKKSRSQYQEAITDLREMRSVFRNQLEAGLRSRGCTSQALLALADTLDNKAIEEKSRLAKAETLVPTAPQADTEVIRASTATFFVDNKDCSETLNVHVDGTLLGQVAPGTKAAFQSLMGRHSLCLLSANSTETCGDAETLRNGFVYDGWSVSRHCEASP